MTPHLWASNYKNGFHIVGLISKDVLPREFWDFFFLVLVLGVLLLDVGCYFLMMGGFCFLFYVRCFVFSFFP